MRPRRSAFLAVGAGSLALYACLAAWVPLLPTSLYQPLLDLGKITGYSWPAAQRFAFLVVGLFALYGLGYRLVGRGAGSTAGLLGFAAAFALVLLWAYPATAADVFGYVAHGRVLALHGSNPFLTPPSAITLESIEPYLAYPDEPSQYGPLWVLLGAGITLLTGGDLLREVLLYKLLAIAAHLAGAGLVGAVLRRLGADRRRVLAGILLYAWNPLLLWEAAANAHNDALMVVGLLLAVWLLARANDRWVLLALSGAALVKVPAVAIAPVLLLALWRRSRWAAVEGVLLALALAVVAYRPFWAGLETLTPLGRGGLFTASLGSVLQHLLEAGYGEHLAMRLARSLTLGLLALVLLPILRRAAATRSAAGAVALAYASLLAALLLGVTWFQAWYVAWPLALAAALPDPARHREAALLSLGAMGSYGVFVYLWVMGVLPDGVAAVQYVAYATIVGPLLAVWCVAGLGCLTAGRGRATRPAGPPA